tara:strand:- start:387 stop:512 length:126 start_codon:yes stop_codon:yes gene_type:complete
MKKSEKIMGSIMLAVMIAMATLVTYNAVAYGTSRDELVITK